MNYRFVLATIFIPSVILGLSVSPSYAAVIGVNSASSLGANDAIDWEQLPIPVGQSGALYTGPMRVFSTDGNVATVSVGGNNIFASAIQAPGGITYANFPPGMHLIDSSHNYEGITISFRHPVYGGGAQIQAAYYGAFTATVTAFDGAHELGTYSVAGTTTTDGLNNPAPFIGLLSDSPDITSLVFFADSVSSPDETLLGTLFLNVRVHPGHGHHHHLDADLLDPAAGVPEPSTWAMLLLGFCGLGVFKRDELGRYWVRRFPIAPKRRKYCRSRSL
jgi:hypothetical protein